MTRGNGVNDMPLVDRPVLDATVVEQVLLGGDLSRLTSPQRLSYYNRVCESLGLNPLTKPFDYLTLNGKTILYARKDCTEQLRNNRSISVTIKAREVVEGCYIVTAQAKLPSGREDESIGAVPIDGLKGDARANGMMKAETKAKRRVTLSICGLGMLDETEIETIPNARVGEPVLPGLTPAVTVQPTLPTEPDGYTDWRINLTATADTGRDALNSMWAKSKAEYRDRLRTTEPTGINALRERAKKAGEVSA